MDELQSYREAWQAELYNRRKLEAAIRKHRDQRGDDRCWLDDEELYKVLPEGYTAPTRDSCVELKLCEKYIASRHNPATKYVSPQREIERWQKKFDWILDFIDGNVQHEVCLCRGHNDDCVHCKGAGFTTPTCALCNLKGTHEKPLIGPNVLLHGDCIPIWAGG